MVMVAHEVAGVHGARTVLGHEAAFDEQVLAVPFPSRHRRSLTRHAAHQQGDEQRRAAAEGVPARAGRRHSAGLSVARGEREAEARSRGPPLKSRLPKVANVERRWEGKKIFAPSLLARGRSQGPEKEGAPNFPQMEEEGCSGLRKRVVRGVMSRAGAKVQVAAKVTNMMARAERKRGSSMETTGPQLPSVSSLRRPPPPNIPTWRCLSSQRVSLASGLAATFFRFVVPIG